ncbi:PDC sensor domain-containing protein [Paraglaciecola psychrophila]|uniref:hypothetical protein n=1 Tax=Paraglaciecola psychrophila TaxID=326544 RepID=UPI000291360B|nr:hypothetical protein [Paraglaciecola psychrophila]GAC39980.1 hypothetical protein GPSY_4377 [Paraglaciecola psychrophila 170]
MNYQQPNGRGLSGTAKSFDTVVKRLNTFKLEETGFVYLVDTKGTIQIHKENKKIGRSLSAVYNTNDVSMLLNKLTLILLKWISKDKQCFWPLAISRVWIGLL